MTYPVKEFVLTHVVENVLQLDGTAQYSQTEEHFNVPWKISLRRYNDHLSFFLYCMGNTKNWQIEANFQMKLVNVVQNKPHTLAAEHARIFSNSQNCWGWSDFISWSKLEQYYVKDGKITLEVHVKILKMTGVEKKKLRNFDESMKEFSDVVLAVKDEKFHVLKLYLASHSTYFKTLLLGNFDELNKSEVILKDIDPEDFQNFLELIHGESVIDDKTIDGILYLADMYDSPVAIRRCEEFLMKDSKMAMKKKLQISAKYKMENLQNKCLSEINTVEDIRSLMPGDASEMDPSILLALLQKSISLH